MRFTFILASAFFLFLAIMATYNFKRRRIGIQAFCAWFAASIVLAIISLFPGLADWLIELVGLKLRENFLLLVLTVIITSFIFIQSSANAVLHRQINRLTQVAAVQAAKLEAVGKGRTRVGRVLVKMAAFNESANIAAVLKAMPDNVDVLVVDDGSADDTAALAAAGGAMVARHEINLGQGLADLTGFMLAFDLGYEIVVEMDADGQHDPADIPAFVALLDNRPDLDLVVGSRILGTQEGQVCPLRKTFLPHYTKMINWASGFRLTDGLCGFKAYRAASLTRRAGLLDGVFETEYIAAEMYIRFGRAGLRLAEIPVRVMERRYGKSRKGTLRYGFAVAWVILRAVLAAK